MRLIPPSDDIDARSHAERKVAGLLAEIRSDDGVAYHSVRLPRHRKKVLGEVDFVVLWRGTILVLEVKGGRIGRTRKGLWYSMDRGGHRHPLRRSPWAQAEDAALTLLHVLSRPSDDGGWPFAYAVVTPDQALGADTEADTEGVLQQHLGSEQMTPAGMERGLDALARLARPLPADQDHPRRLDLGPMGNLPEVLTHLRGEVDTMRTMRTMPTPERAAEGSVDP
jgi:hypothetical protein